MDSLIGNHRTGYYSRFSWVFPDNCCGKNTGNGNRAYTETFDVFSYNAIGENTNVTVSFNGPMAILTIAPFEHTLQDSYSGINVIDLGSCPYYNKDFATNSPIYITINGVWEECILNLSTNGALHIIRKTVEIFPNEAVIKYAMDDYYSAYYVSSGKLMAQLTFWNNPTIE